jgi:hypothetical protein
MVLKGAKDKRNDKTLTEDKANSSETEPEQLNERETEKGQKKAGRRPNHYVRSYHYSYSSRGDDVEELEERVIIDNDRGRVKTRKNGKVEERDLSQNEIKALKSSALDIEEYDINRERDFERLFDWPRLFWEPRDLLLNNPFFTPLSHPKRLLGNREQQLDRKQDECEHCQHCQQPIRKRLTA